MADSSDIIPDYLTPDMKYLPEICNVCVESIEWKNRFSLLFKHFGSDVDVRWLPIIVGLFDSNEKAISQLNSDGIIFWHSTLVYRHTIEEFSMLLQNAAAVDKEAFQAKVDTFCNDYLKDVPEVMRLYQLEKDNRALHRILKRFSSSEIKELCTIVTYSYFEELKYFAYNYPRLLDKDYKYNILQVIEDCLNRLATDNFPEAIEKMRKDIFYSRDTKTKQKQNE